MKKVINIVIPMSGAGTSFIQAGFTFPKPLIDINGKPMIQLCIENLTPKTEHNFIFVYKKEYDKYSLHQIFNNTTKGNFAAIPAVAPTQGALCSVLNAVDYINNDQELIVANADQVIDVAIDDFIKFARESKADGVIMTFNSHHPRWSYSKVDKADNVLEVAEKKVISDQATVGIYYFKRGLDFVKASFSMIEKNIRFNNDFYVCPVFNEMILSGKKIINWEIKQSKMHGLGTPEDLNRYINLAEKKGK